MATETPSLALAVLEPPADQIPGMYNPTERDPQLLTKEETTCR
jgi:hypothetical protein